MSSDSFQTVREAGVKATTGLMMTFTDEELRNGSHESRRLHNHRAEHHPEQTPPPIYYPAGKPLLTDAQIRLWRNAQSGSYKIDSWLFKSFVQAYRYAMGKPAETKQGYVIQKGRSPRRA
jgi:hypothetical protein